ncbi:hypothetical protein ACFE04_013488 [Oxalis oulophora]
MTRVYENFEPEIEWRREEGRNNFTVHLPEFVKQQIKVQGNFFDKLRISGMRHIGDNRWKRFDKEITLPTNYDPLSIKIEFDKGLLHEGALDNDRATRRTSQQSTDEDPMNNSEEAKKDELNSSSSSSKDNKSIVEEEKNKDPSVKKFYMFVPLFLLVVVVSGFYAKRFRQKELKKS